jgi:hypothetical protein
MTPDSGSRSVWQLPATCERLSKTTTLIPEFASSRAMTAPEKPAPTMAIVFILALPLRNLLNRGFLLFGAAKKSNGRFCE